MVKPIFITNARKTSIEGVLYATPGKLLVIVCNGFNDVYTHPSISTLVQLIHGGGFSIFTFNYARDSSGIHVQNPVAGVEQISSVITTWLRML